MKNPNLKLAWKLFPLSCLIVFIGSGLTAQNSGPATQEHEVPSAIMNNPAQITGKLDPSEISRTREGSSTLQIVPKSVNTDISGLKLPDVVSATESTGALNFDDQTDRLIPDEGYRHYTFTPSETLPYGAVVTDLFYVIRVDDRGDETDFYPSDYDIYLSSESQGGYTFHLVWDQTMSSSNTDEGDDDDSSNDSDIELYWRSTHIFDGEPADQFYTVSFYDNVSFPGSEGLGKVDYVTLQVFWEAPDLPNLNPDYTPSGWDSPMVINHTEHSKTNASTLYANTTTYLNTAYINEDFDIPASTVHHPQIYIDGSLQTSYSMSGANAGWYYTFENRTYTLTTGEHTICHRVDGGNDVLESDESDNEYCRTLTWIGPPSSPSLVSPTHQATCQPTNVQLDWNPVDHAISYQLQVDDNSDFSSPVYDLDGIISSQKTPTGLSNGAQYYWRVRGWNPAGNGSWSAVRSFRTAPASAPSAPGLDSPADGANCQSTTLILDCVSEPDAESYKLQVDDNLDFSSPVVNLTGLSSTENEVTGLIAGTRYYWRYAAVNDCGMSSGWSSIWDFITESTPSAPSLSSPSNEITCQSTSLTLSWSDVSGAASYNVQVDNNNDFSSIEINQTDITGTSVEISGIDPGTTYYWKVIAKNSCDNYSGWSSIRSFSTSPAVPGSPGTSLPAYESDCQPLALTLEWSAGSGASTYMLQLDDNDDFSSPVVDETSIASTSHAISGLSEGNTYYWRVKSVNTCSGESEWSSTSNFSTLIISITVPVLSDPANAAECLPTEPTLVWQAVENATGYSIEVDDNDDFSSPEYSGSCEGTSHNCDELSESSLYYWRVSASGNCSVTGSWSDSRSFETGSDGMEVPILDEPADNSTDQPLSLTISWTEITDASDYQFQLDDNEDLSSPVYDEEVTGNSIEVSGLEEDATYFWQVRAKGACSSSGWSEIWQFATLEGSGPDNISIEYEDMFYLGQNYPNPFMETTIIEFSLPVGGKVDIEFFDLQGKIIETITKYYLAGKHAVEFNVNGKVQSGVYIYRMRALDFTDTKLCVVK